MSSYHTSVLLQETIAHLQIKPGEKYIDATLGGGGHSLEIVRHGGKVLGIDVDQDAIDEVTQKCKDQIGKEIVLAKGNFRNIDTIARENGFTQVAGILFDFGVSSHQIDDPERGFSFTRPGPLDMRMDQELSVTANDLVNGLHKKELMELFDRFGEEQFAHGIANEIVKVRKEKMITTTQDLIDIIDRVMPSKLNKMAAAARIFQALRIVVNDELHSIEEALPKAITLLQRKGRIVAISFHSLEDRIVKQQFIDFANRGLGTIYMNEPILATAEEIEGNMRSRSAKMRIFEKK